jgi:phospho-acceptor domain-containing protein
MSDATQRLLQQVAAAVVHELRTPLAALHGEIELALRRDRSPQAYREVLGRLEVLCAELTEMSADLALLADPPDHEALPAQASRLDDAVRVVIDRYRTNPAVRIAEPAGDLWIAGEGRLVSRALTLLVDHALRHRRARDPVILGLAPVSAMPTLDRVEFTLAAPPAGFWPDAWRSIEAGAVPGGNVDAAESTRPPSVRLRAAQVIVERCGGTLRPVVVDGVSVLLIELLCAVAV